MDVDKDGIGEYGTFAEMTGTEGVRTSADGASRGAVLSPCVASPALANADANGIVTKSGYAFRIYLPGTGGNAVHEGAASRWTGGGSCGSCCPKRSGGTAPAPTPRVLVPGSPFTGPVDTDLAEKRWCAYAWPVARGNSGMRAFFVDETGSVYQCANDRIGYSGLARGPAFDAAFAPGGGPGWGIVVPGKPGRDGEVWKVTN